VSEAEATVFVVDDDPSVLRAMARLLTVAGLRVVTFASAGDFLNCAQPEGPACLVLDVHMPGLSGLDLQRKLAERGIRIPVIFITGNGNIPMSVQAMKAGAVEFLTKPFLSQILLDAIRQAIERDRVTRGRQADFARLRQRFDTLTPREKEVMAFVVQGLLNKQIAAQLGIGEKTVKVHRARVMHKMEAPSFADLVRMGERLRNRET
jgi:FixJ family two-component response regulator